MGQVQVLPDGVAWENDTKTLGCEVSIAGHAWGSSDQLRADQLRADRSRYNQSRAGSKDSSGGYDLRAEEVNGAH